MSETTLYAVYQKVSRGIEDYRNGWLSAPLLWDHLARIYLNKPDGMGFGEDYDELWKLARDQRVPEHFRIAHAMTFDTCLVSPKAVKDAARACCMVGDSLINDENHWGAIGRDLWKVGKPDRRMIGYALNVTSVNDHWGRGARGVEGDLMCAVEYARALLR